MPDIVLKDRAGNDLTYAGAPSVKVPNTSGELVEFFSGEKVEKTIDPDFSEGNIEVIPEEGTFLEKVTIIKPETLVPENIKKNEVVAGIKGTCEGGGSTIPTVSHNDKDWIDDICFWDIDGTLIQQIKVEEAASLEDLPTPPAKTNLTFVGWNYTLEEIKTLGRPLDVGAVYDTVDGKIYLTLNVSNSSYKAVPIHFSQSIANGVTINWGDGSTSKSATAGVTSLTHTYSSTGTKNITITIADGCELLLGGGTSATTFVGGNTSNYRNYLTAAYLPSGVKLNPYCFYNNYYVTRITLPPDLLELPNYAFYSLYKIGYTIIPPKVVSLGQYAIYNVSGNYNSRTCGGISLPESVETLGNYSLAYNYFLKRLIIPTKITVIPQRCCQNNQSCKKIILPTNLKTIDSYAFFACQNILTIDIPEGTETLNSNAFYNCYSLKEITIPDSVTSLGDYLFYYCYSLRKVVIGEGITTIPNHMLYYCHSLQEIKLPKNLTTIGDNFLYQCYGILEVDIPENVTTVGKYFCGYANSLQKLIIRGAITTAGGYALSSAYALREIIFLKNSAASKIYSCNLYCSYYVPDDAVSDFNSNWGMDYKYGIKPLS